MEPNDRDPPDQDSAEPTARRRGASPVVQGTRSKLGMLGGSVCILLVVGFLFMTGGNGHTAAAPAKAPPAIPAASGSTALPAPELPSKDGVSSFEVPNNPQHFERASAGGETAEAAQQKAEARLHSPMLIYDTSGHEETAPAPQKPPGSDAVNALMAAQLQNAATAGGEEQHRDRSSPAEGYAERTAAFAKSASDEHVQEDVARHVSLRNRIAQGRMVPAILETAISSDLPGKLRAIVSQDVWGEDGGQKLIRRGSRLVGEYRSGLVRGQTRVFVIWTRLLEPDGTDLAIGSPGSDDLGRAGLTGEIDNHFVERFGAAFLLSLIGSATTASQGGNTFVINTSQGFGQVAQDSLQDSVNIPPTIFVDQGTPVQVFVARDLVFDPMPLLGDARP